MSDSTGIRLNRNTIEEMRIAAQEIGMAQRIILTSDDDRVSALVDHWNATKTTLSLSAAQNSGGATPPR